MKENKKSIHFGYFLKRNFVSIFLLILLLTAAGFSLAALPRLAHDTISVIYWPILGDMLIPLFFMLPAVIFRQRVLSIAAVSSAYFLLFFRIASLLLYRQTFLPLDFYSLGILWEHTDHSSLTALLGKGYYWWAIPLLLLTVSLMIYGCILIWNICQKHRQHLSRFWVYLFALLLCVSAVSNVFYYWQTTLPEVPEYCGKLVRPVPFSLGEICKNSWQALSRHAGAKENFFPEKLPEDSSEYLFSSGVLPPPVTLLPSENLRKNPPVFDRVLIIAAESLDLDYIGAMNPAMPKGITPTLDRLTGEYLCLTNYYTAAQPTSWGLNAMILSRLDYARDRYYPPGPTLFSLAGASGYSTAYFSGISGLFGNNAETYRELFRPQALFFLEEWERQTPALPKYFWGISDADLFSCVLRQIRETNSPRFLYLVSTLDTHPPYTVTPAEGEEKCDWGNPFLNALHAFDGNLDRFLKEFMTDPRLYNEKTLIVITADHSATHGANYLKRNNYLPERIPLILITPNRKALAGISRDTFASSIDLAPTLLPLIGEKAPNCFMGRDLRGKRSFAISRTMDDHLLIRSENDLREVDLSGERPDTMPEKAFFDFFYLFYKK